MSFDIDKPRLPPAYVSIYLIAAKVANEHGYALCCHGSFATDLDLVAVPWLPVVSTRDELVDSLCERLSAMRGDPMTIDGRRPPPKPHGRVVETLLFGGGYYIDLSVMPAVEPMEGYE